MRNFLIYNIITSLLIYISSRVSINKMDGELVVDDFIDKPVFSDSESIESSHSLQDSDIKVIF